MDSCPGISRHYLLQTFLQTHLLCIDTLNTIADKWRMNKLPTKSFYRTDSASKHANISSNDRQKFHTTRFLPYNEGTPWWRKSCQNLFYATKGFFDGAETCEIVEELHMEQPAIYAT